MTTLTVAMHGVTGRMGTNQHFLRSILAIIRQGGVKTSSGEMIQVTPVLLGRDESKLKYLAETVTIAEIGRPVDWSTDVDAVISDSSVDIVFDSSSTKLRGSIVRKAGAAGKAIYCEKPVAIEEREAFELAEYCESLEVKNGVVQDKLWLPGMRKLRALRDDGYFGEILNVQGQFGYWVFTGQDPGRPPQRPSWNYRRSDGGGIISDMFCHYHYLIEDLFGPIDRVLAHAVTAVTERVDESGLPYACTAEDTAYATFVLDGGVTCQWNSSFATRVRRDDLLTVQVDGTQGSAVAGTCDCWVQSVHETPRAVWNPDVSQSIDFFGGWTKLSHTTQDDNAFKIQWELFLRHVAGDGEFPWSLRRGAEGVALAGAGETSWRENRWLSLAERRLRWGGG